MTNNNVDIDEVDDVVPLKSNNVDEVDTNNLPDLSQIDMSKMGDMMETLKNKNPADLLRMMRGMGISDSQIEQMKKQYKNGGLTDHSQEPDLRKRLRTKMNEMRTMRHTNTVKQQYIEKIQEEKGPMAASVNPVAVELSKKTLANRKKAQKKKEKKKAEKEQALKEADDVNKDDDNSELGSDEEEIKIN
jgi:magnesium-transporting ATPase (P-type)